MAKRGSKISLLLVVLGLVACAIGIGPTPAKAATKYKDLQRQEAAQRAAEEDREATKEGLPPAARPNASNAVVFWVLYSQEKDDYFWEEEPKHLRRIFRAEPFAVPDRNLRPVEPDDSLATFRSEVRSALLNIRGKENPNLLVDLESHGCNGAICQQHSKNIPYSEVMNAVFGAVDEVFPGRTTAPEITIICSACHSGSLRPPLEDRLKTGEGKYRVSLLTSTDAERVSLHRETRQWLAASQRELRSLEREVGEICTGCGPVRKQLKFFYLLNATRRSSEKSKGGYPVGFHQFWSNHFEAQEWSAEDLAKVAVHRQNWAETEGNAAAERLKALGADVMFEELKKFQTRTDGSVAARARSVFAQAFPDDPRTVPFHLRELESLFRMASPDEMRGRRIIAELVSNGQEQATRSLLEKMPDVPLKETLLRSLAFSCGDFQAGRGSVSELREIYGRLRRNAAARPADVTAFLEGAAVGFNLGEEVSQSAVDWIVETGFGAEAGPNERAFGLAALDGLRKDPVIASEHYASVKRAIIQGVPHQIGDRVSSSLVLARGKAFRNDPEIIAAVRRAGFTMGPSPLESRLHAVRMDVRCIFIRAMRLIGE